MKNILVIIFLLLSLLAGAQNAIDWDGKYQLQLSDFQSPATQIGGGSHYSLYNGASFDFSYSMSRAEFVFTKNFNSKVNCSFKRDAAAIVAPDHSIAEDLLNYARFGFDLSELYARKLRKRLYEEKGAFSNASFFQPVYAEVNKECIKRNTLAGKATDLGRNKEKLHELHQEVLNEIIELGDFCKTCKPPKKKKK